jgi:hypothetical protein
MDQASKMLSSQRDGASKACRGKSRLRVAIVSTPRSGNTWLRQLLASAYRVHTLAVHRPGDIDWSQLPDDCVLQLHWHPTAEFRELLDHGGFRPLVLARHPLDVLLSILHFALHDESADRWLDGQEGNELAICGAMPTSAAFVEYATGPRARALLSISRQWWQEPACLHIRYEDLVADPVFEFNKLQEQLGVFPRASVEEAIGSASLAKMRADSRSKHHFWQGTPGLWRKMFPGNLVAEIAASLQADFSEPRYSWDADPELTHAQAEANWIECNRTELTQRLRGLTRTIAELEEARSQVALTQQTLLERTTDLAHCRQALQQTEKDLLWTQKELDLFRKELDRHGELGPIALRVAQALRRSSLRLPKTAKLVKRFLAASSHPAGA